MKIKCDDGLPVYCALDYLFPGFYFISLFSLFSEQLSGYQRIEPREYPIVGLNNWISVSSDELFWRSLFNVIFNQVIFVLLSFVLAMGMALLLHEITHFGGLFRTIMFIPVITSITVAMIIFNFLSSPAGPVQSLLLEWGVLDAPVFWKFERWLPMPLIAVFSTWKWFGIQMIIFWAALPGSVSRCMRRLILMVLPGAGKPGALRYPC